MCVVVRSVVAGEATLKGLRTRSRESRLFLNAVFPGYRNRRSRSDIPGLGPADIAAGFRALGRADAVFGPALDGGYWLVGFGPRRPHRPFVKARWSSPHALADTLANFRRHRVALLPPKRDVDSAEDLAALTPTRD